VGGRRRFRHSDAVRQRGGTAEAVHGSGGRALAGGQARRQGGDRLHLLDDDARGTGIDDPRPQQHPLPLGHAHPPARLHGERGFNAGGNPYGTSYTSGKRVEVPTRERSPSPATRASGSPATPPSSAPPARRTPSASSGRGRSASRRPRSTESAVQSTGGRKYPASRFLWSPRGEPLKPEHEPLAAVA